MLRCPGTSKAHGKLPGAPKQASTRASGALFFLKATLPLKERAEFCPGGLRIPFRLENSVATGPFEAFALPTLLSTVEEVMAKDATPPLLPSLGLRVQGSV